jgi:AcrR family transcriptional regulator
LPHLSKTSAHHIVAAGLSIVETKGRDSLTMRAVARQLRLAPNALYYYFPDRKSLEGAIAVEGFRRLYALVERAWKRPAKSPRESVERLCHTYVGFARANPSLYALMWASRSSLTEWKTKSQNFMVIYGAYLRALTGEPDVEQTATAIWALIHGIIVLEREQLLRPNARAKAAFGIDALLRGLERRGPAVRTPRKRKNTLLKTSK